MGKMSSISGAFYIMKTGKMLDKGEEDKYNVLKCI